MFVELIGVYIMRMVIVVKELWMMLVVRFIVIMLMMWRESRNCRLCLFSSPSKSPVILLRGVFKCRVDRVLMELEWRHIVLVVILMVELSVYLMVWSKVHVWFFMMVVSMTHNVAFPFSSCSFKVTEVILLLTIFKSFVNGMLVEIIRMDIVLMIEIMV